MADQKNALSIAFDLGYVYLKEDKKKINKFKKRLSEEDIICIWNKINEKKPNYENLKGYARPLDRLKKEMLRDKFYLEKISNDSIVSFGKNPKWCLLAFRGLIRKNTKRQFPAKAIVALGEDNEAIAKIILEKLKSKKKLKYKIGYYKVSAQWARRYPALRSDIAAIWQNHFALYPLTTAEREFIQKEMVELKKYIEFKNIDLNARKSRDGGPVNCEWSTSASHFFTTLCVGTTLVGGVIFFGSIAPPLLFYMKTKAAELGAAALTSGMTYVTWKPPVFK